MGWLSVVYFSQEWAMYVEIELKKKKKKFWFWKFGFTNIP